MKNGSSSNIHFCINNHLFIKYFFNWIKTTFLAFMRSIWWEPLDHSEQVNSHKESMYQNGRKYWKCPRICLPNLSAQFVCPSPKVLEFNEKRLHWASVVRAFRYVNDPLSLLRCRCMKLQFEQTSFKLYHARFDFSFFLQCFVVKKVLSY